MGQLASWSHQSQWGDVHITGGILFIMFACWHTLNNFGPIKAYFRRTFSGAKFWPLAGSILICLLAYGGTILEIQPMHQLSIWGEAIKKNHAKTYADPPFGHAEMSTLLEFCTFLGLDANAVVEGLNKEGISCDAGSVFKNIAESRDMTPQELYEQILKITGSFVPARGKGRRRESAQTEIDAGVLAISSKDPAFIRIFCVDQYSCQ